MILYLKKNIDRYFWLSRQKNNYKFHIAGMKWFKFYGQDFITDPKMGALSTPQRLIWVYLLSMASQSDKKDGVLRFVTLDHLRQLAGITTDEENYSLTDKTLEIFEEMQLIEWIDENTLKITNYEKYQEMQLTDAERAKRYRDNKKLKLNVTNVTEIQQDSHTRIDKIREDNIYINDAKTKKPRRSIVDNDSEFNTKRLIAQRQADQLIEEDRIRNHLHAGSSKTIFIVLAGILLGFFTCALLNFSAPKNKKNQSSPAKAIIMPTAGMVVSPTMSPEKIIDKIHGLESTWGTAPSGLHVYCRRLNMWNEYGYDSPHSFCFENKTEADEMLLVRFLKEQKEDWSIAQIFCYYNTGYKLSDCGYYRNSLLIK